MRTVLCGLVLAVAGSNTALACGMTAKRPPGAVLDAVLPTVRLAGAERPALREARRTIASLAAARRLNEAWALEDRTMASLGFRKVEAPAPNKFRCGGSVTWTR